MYNRAQDFAKKRPDRPGRGDAESRGEDLQGNAERQRLEGGTRSCRPITCLLFSDSPLVLAQAEAAKPAENPAPPPAIVNASRGQPQAVQGQAALILPANPAEPAGDCRRLLRTKPGPPRRRSRTGPCLRAFRPIAMPAFMSRAGRS